jgi:nucleoside-diphosphate-sugar epimerase
LTSVLAASASDQIRADLDPLLERDESLWASLGGARLFVTGGTGFVGKWLLESLVHANERLGLGTRAVVLTRNPQAFGVANPRLFAAPGIEWVRGDVRDFVAPAGSFTHAIHAATDVVADAKPRDTFDVILKGTESVLDLCDRRGIGDLLIVSSGAVYGRQPPDMERLDEMFEGAPSTVEPQTAYGQGKRASEWLAVAQGTAGGPSVRIARLFAFVGPYLPMDRHLAIGNFLADCLAGRQIEVKGDGTAVRSYLYAADLARWLWTILLRGAPGEAYNVGSEQTIGIAALARLIAVAWDNGTVPVRVKETPVAGRLPERYVPSTRKAREALGLEPTISLNDAILRTLAWSRAQH